MFWNDMETWRVTGQAGERWSDGVSWFIGPEPLELPPALWFGSGFYLFHTIRCFSGMKISWLSPPPLDFVRIWPRVRLPQLVAGIFFQILCSRSYSNTRVFKAQFGISLQLLLKIITNLGLHLSCPTSNHCPKNAKTLCLVINEE